MRFKNLWVHPFAATPEAPGAVLRSAVVRADARGSFLSEL